MIDETKLRPWVDSEVDENGDLHLTSSIDETATVATYTVMSMRNRQIHKWLKDQGWAPPEIKAELLDALEMMLSLSNSDGPAKALAESVAQHVIAKAKGEQG